jgi:sugar lactone lactonase YvrE
MKRIAKISLRILIIILVIIVISCIGMYFYLNISSPHLLRFSKDVNERTVSVLFESLPGAIFIKGMKGCENLYLDNTSQRVYVTDLNGYIHLLNGTSWKTLKLVKSKKVAAFAMGIAKGPDKQLYFNACESPGSWDKEGGAVWRMDMELNSPVKLTGNYQCINGLAIDKGGNLYFASGNAKILHPDGNIFRAKLSANGSLTKPDVFLAHVGWANGLYFSPEENRLYFSNTIEGCFSFDPESPKVNAVYYKTKIMESIDDLCTDTSGRIWMTDPGKSAVKMFNPENRHLTRYIIKGIGQTSSVRIRKEQGGEILYITELKQKTELMSPVFDGRGVIVIPLKSLEQ